MWPRVTRRSIIAINAVHRRVLIVSRHAPGVLRRAAPYAIGVPLMIAIPAAGVIGGLRLAHDPRFAGNKTPLLDPFIAAGFFLVGAFFTAVSAVGLLAAMGIAAFLTLAIFLLCAKLLGWLVITSVRGNRARKPATDLTTVNTPQFADQPDESEPAAVG